jgi:hypothetical protein
MGVMRVPNNTIPRYVDSTYTWFRVRVYEVEERGSRSGGKVEREESQRSSEREYHLHLADYSGGECA